MGRNRHTLVAAAAAAVAAVVALAGDGPGREISTWAVYYSDTAAPGAFDAYDLVILDSDAHPPLGPLKEKGKTLLGYLSAGEVEQSRLYYGELRNEGLLLGTNRHWKNSRYIDVRDERWTRRVVEELVPAILQKGFDGLFLDALDDAAELEDQAPDQNKGMKQAMARLVNTVRKHFPTIPIMINRGYELLPLIEKSVDMELAECLYTDYDEDGHLARVNPPAQYEDQLRLLKAAKARRPGLRLFSLDYWDPGDAAGVARIYKAERAQGLIPYVATLELDRLVAEPKP